ncbi:hypothetical protein SAMN05216559_2298 [Halomicrobium zhouii]|uniref:PD(D/E)XK endonuclease domain-containing protein n=1 Tax=Halomicrobium zhouii TaxID=767519 RepID=A0A1I6L9W5_9EURY|nr:hypothetical protein SAMN05216559_2298 [Halomicrobium zhouii]
MNRSHKANHYGTLCERKAVHRYGLELDRSSWHDARRDDGTPVEIKSTMRRHADGQPGNFKLYSKYHRRLWRTNGWYIFIIYRVRGNGLQVLKSEMRHSSRLPQLSWHGGGQHRDAKQAKILINSLF